MARGIVIIGSTGSIGRQALDVARTCPDDVRIVGLAGGRNRELLAAQVREWSPAWVAAPGLSPGNDFHGARVREIDELCALPQAERVLISTVGSAGLVPTLAALRAGKSVALANKEVLVMAGDIVVETARQHGGELIPVDSEHNALWQCLTGDCQLGVGAAVGPVERVIITASGGAFRDYPVERLAEVTPAQALAHPNWVMGPKVTVDSATLMNKGFEVIEAHWLFGLPYEQIHVLLHRESLVHAMAEFVDGSIRATLGPA
ncbi:MAG TPA: 1-deoxy-D-xylulose-5-phosphate reductoisomerase, partial [Chloroflexota bacterium]|nr:1-deoxy-D-xylulose-5-phosphate reductoisomerase [Chloroflexota bacterium]